MKAILGLLLVAGLALGGCGNNDCEDAADKLKECGATSDSSPSSGDCSGASECVAKCINSASCDDLKSTDFNGKYWQCIAACAK